MLSSYWPHGLENGSSELHFKINAVTQGAHMNLIYNSEQYSVFEFVAEDGQDALHVGGYEIMDKPGKREIFIRGTVAAVFRKNVEDLIASAPSEEDIDDFLGKYEVLMRQPMVFH
jgi:hypothetical protein